MEKNKTFTCCICGEVCSGYGNNPAPIVTEEGKRCCDTCNLAKVLPARIKYVRENYINKGDR